MSKIEYLRSLVVEHYEKQDLDSALEIGQTLLEEHWHIRNMWTMGYADDLFNIAKIHEELGDIERAVELYSDSANQVLAVEGDNLNYAERLQSIAILLDKVGINDPAYFFHLQAAAIVNRALGNQDNQYADCLYNLGNAAADIGRHSDSLVFHLDAYKIREKSGDPKDLINSLNCIAFAYEAVDDYEKALYYAEEALDLTEVHLGKDEFAGACFFLATLYENIEQLDDALDLYDLTLKVIVDEVGFEHSAYVSMAYKRANLLAGMDRLREALISHNEIRALFEEKLGTEHAYYANCLRSMAILHRDLGEIPEAESMMLKSLKVRRQASNDISIDILFLLRMYLREKRHTEAIDTLVYALMCADTEASDFQLFLDSIAETFTYFKEDGGKVLEEAIEVLGDQDKLVPIMSKWEEWEDDRL